MKNLENIAGNEEEDLEKTHESQFQPIYWKHSFA